MIYYRQCKLNRNGSIQTAWIPEKFAKRGKYLRIKQDDGWLVEEVYGRQPEDWVISKSQDYKVHRDATDI